MRLMDHTRDRCNQKIPTSCRAYEMMCMMWCVGSQSSVSQMNFLLHGSVWLRSMDSNPSTVHHVVRMRSCAWCHASGARAEFHRWISCFMVLSGCKAWIHIRLHHVVRMGSCAWCDASGAKAVFHRWISCFMVLSGCKAWIQIRLHHVVRMRSCAWTNA